MIRPPPLKVKPDAEPPERLRGYGLVFASVALVLLLLAAGGFYLAMRDTGAALGRTEVRLGGTRLSFDAAFARFASERVGGDMEQVDLAVSFPDFAPAGEIKGLTPQSDLLSRQEKLLFLTLTLAGKTLDPAERTAKLYARFLEPEEWSQAGGLVMRRFVPGSPFESEDLYLTPPEGKAFAARCMRPAASADGLPDSCIHDFRLGALNVQLRFSPARLADWEALGTGARLLVARMLR